MKRPIAVFGLVFLVVLAVHSYIGAHISVIHITIAAAALLFILISLFVKPLRTKISFTIALAVLSAAALFISFSKFVYMPAISMADGKTHTVKASFCDLADKIGRFWFYRLKAEEVDGEPKNFYFVLKSPYEYKFEPYDEINSEINFEESGYSPYIANRFYLSASSDEKLTLVKTNSHFLNALLLKVRKSLLNTVDELYSRTDASFIKAILLGDKSELSYELKDSFRAAGISHMLVLSGMHMSIISGVFIYILRKTLKKHRRFANAFAVFPIIGFMMITGFPRSLVRSGIMLITVLIADSIYRDSDPLNSLGIAAIILCVINPFSVYDVGMLMSFSATAGIILYYERFCNFVLAKFKFLSDKALPYALISFIVKPVGLSLSATIAILPFSLLLFGQVSNIMLLSNILIVPLAPAIMILAALSVIFSHSLLFLAKPAAFLAAFLTRSVIIITQSLSALPFARTYVTKSYIAYCGTAAAILLMIILQLKKKKLLLKISALILSLIFLICSITDLAVHRRNADIKVYCDSGGYIVSVEYSGIVSVFYSCNRSQPSSAFSDIIEQTADRISLFCALNNVSSTQYTVREFLCRTNIRNIILNCNEKSFSPDFTVKDGTEILCRQTDYKVEICSGISAEFININGNFWTMLNVLNENLLIVPYGAKKKDVEKFSRLKGEEGISLIIAGEKIKLTDEIVESADDVFYVPSYISGTSNPSRIVKSFLISDVV